MMADNQRLFKTEFINLLIRAIHKSRLISVISKTMKRIKIYAYQAALVFKNGVYKRMLQEGTWWLGFRENVIRYDITSQFIAPADMNILLQDA